LYLAFAFGLAALPVQAASLDCKFKAAIPYEAQLAGSGDSRSVTVGFHRGTSGLTATPIVRACMQVVVDSDPNHDLLGSAWIGEQQLYLAQGHENLVYKRSEKKIRPYSYHEAFQELSESGKGKR
jgi:hypothetical protein